MIRFLLRYPLAAGCAALVLLASCSETATAPPDDTPDETYLAAGGATTISLASSHAYSQPAPNLSAASMALHLDGDRSFEQTFVTAPAGVNAGLGPQYNNVSCINCHVRDGRGRPPLPGESMSSMLLRISVPGTASTGGPEPVPGFGDQLQIRSVAGMAREADALVAYGEYTLLMADGTPVSMRVPSYTITQPYQSLPATVLISPRIAPPVFGLGLLEAVSEADILRYADEHDANGDGISGRPNYVWDVVAHKPVIGRFGWKANQPNLLQQAAAAYNGDMGVTSSLFPKENCDGAPGCSSVDIPDIDDETLRATAFYTRTLAVPAPRTTTDKTVSRGRVVFAEAGCASCHRPAMRTSVVADAPELSNQTISAFTDLLLHDMGEELSDNRPDYLATGREWRTPPLWGIGLTRIVNGYETYLHDGRARTLLEAIMWHGGEAARARDYVRALPTTDRTALLSFLSSL